MIKYWWLFIWAHVLAHMYWNFNLSFPINLLLHTEQQNSYSLRNSRYILVLFLSILEILILNSLVGFSFCMTKFPEIYSDLFSFFSFLKGFHWSTVLQINVFRMTGDFFIQAYQRWSWAGGLGPQWGSRKKTIIEIIKILLCSVAKVELLVLKSKTWSHCIDWHVKTSTNLDWTFRKFYAVTM